MLIKKLQIYGVRGINLAWFRSYLANRKQYISLDHDLGTQNILSGNPQDSVLGPFADDTNLFFELKNIIFHCQRRTEQNS